MAGIKREQLVAMNQHYRRFTLDYFLDCQKKVGFKNIELWCGASHFWVDSTGHEDVTPLKQKLKDRGLKVVSVTTPSMAYQYQYASQEKEIIEESYRYFCNGIHVAADLGADRVVVNSGWGYLNEDESDMWKRCRDNLHRVAEEAGRQGITCCMESLMREETNIVYNLERAERMYRDVNHPALKMMVDTVAMGNAGETLEQWFKTFGTDIYHMHFLDGPDHHDIWGEGCTSLSEQIDVINKYGYTGYLVQEVANDKYFSDPFQADIRNMRVLERFIEE